MVNCYSNDNKLHLPRIIGLTGGIATGKTTVSNYLATAHHLTVLDADVYARVAVEPSSPVLKGIAERYGSDILLADGTLNRRKLGEIVFSNLDERRWLEQQIHPYVRERLIEAIPSVNVKNVHGLPLQTVVLAVPLLFEAGMTDLATEIWVVSCSRQQQLERLMQRDGLTLEQAQARINSQMPIEEKAARANIVLDNSTTLEALLRQVDLAVSRGH